MVQRCTIYALIGAALLLCSNCAASSDVAVAPAVPTIALISSVPTATAIPAPTTLPAATATAIPAPTALPTATATPAPTASPTATAIPTPAPISTPLATACGEQHGIVLREKLRSHALGREEAYRIYTPACYNQQPNQRYPVVYLLHGGEHNDEHWNDIGVDQTADTLIAAGTITPLLIVMPDGGQDFGPLGGNPPPFAAYLHDELIPHIDAATVPKPAAPIARLVAYRMARPGRCCWRRATRVASAQLAHTAQRSAHLTASTRIFNR